MRKTFYHIGMLAATALAFIACNKETEIQQPAKEATHVATISLGKAADFKTTVVEGDAAATYKWLQEDAQYLHVYENNVEGEITNFALSSDNTIATLTVSFTGNPDGPYTYTAKYAKTLSNSKNPLVPAEQSPKADSFDPAADVLVSKATADVTNLDERATEFSFTMGRVVTVNKMTLTGLAEGEVISSVEFTLDKTITGYASFDEGNNTYKYTNGGAKITLKYTGTNGTVPANGQFPVYFTCAPVDAAGIVSVIVTTDKNAYVKSNTLNPNPFEGKTISFSIGTMKRFTMAMAGYGEPVSESVRYFEVTSNEQIADGGVYLITSTKTDGDVVVMGTYNEARYYNPVDVTVTNDQTLGKYIDITSEQVVPVTLITARPGQFYIKDADGMYMLYTGSSNNVLRNDEIDYTVYAYNWQVSANQIESVNVEGRKLQYNAGSPRFACYSSSQRAIALYYKEGSVVVREDAGMSWSSATASATMTDEGTVFTAPTITLGHAHDVTYNSTNTEAATISSTGEVEIVAAGTTTIQAIFAGDDTYKPSTVEYTLTVTDNRSKFTTVAELNALATSTETEVTGTLTNAIISFAPDTKNAIIKDATGSVLVYKTDHGYVQGQTFTGNLTVKIKLYNNACEITAIDAEFTGDGAEVNPETVTLSTLVGNFSTWQNAYVHVEDLEVVSVSGKNINVKNGDNTYVVYSSASNATCVAGDIISVTGTIAQFSNNDQVKAWSADDIVVTGHVTVSLPITFSQPSTGGTFTVSVDGSPITSGTTVEEGKVVTLTATAADNYTFNGWTVTGATVSGNSATATFTMGTSPVTVSASFTSTIASEHIATISFGSGTNSTNINSASVTGNDSEGNNWTITTAGTSSFTPNAGYAQVGSSKAPATSITFTTTLSKDATNISLEAKFGGFSGTAGDITLNVGDNSIGTGALNGTTDVTVKSTSTGSGKVLTVTVTNIAKGVKCYSIKATYTN